MANKNKKVKPKGKALLSICIPTYHGEKYIKDTLESIAKQKVRGVKIIIADDSKDDATFRVIDKFKKEHPEQKIVYKRNTRTLGFDKNVLRVVSLARSKYCWLFGQDDKLLPGSIKKVIEVIKENNGVTLMHSNYARYDNSLKKITAKTMTSLTNDSKFKNAEEFMFKPIKKSYFKSLGTNVITMSTDIINRKKWLKAASLSKKYIGHNFIHCFTIAKMIKDSPYIYYIGKPQVWYRSKNERVWPNDVWKDYNEVFIKYLIQLNYNKKQARNIKKKQKKYEKREALMKHKVLKFLYPYTSPILGIYRLLRLRLFSR